MNTDFWILSMNLAIDIFLTDWGYVAAAACEQGLVRVALPCKTKQSARRSLLGQLGRDDAGATEADPRDHASKIIEAARAQISEYLSRKRRTFDLPISPTSASRFARAVWQACCEIPYGETRSYGWIARRIGQPESARAVGRALGANPLPLVIPCHRVVRSDGSLGGFGGGLAMKRRLLALEKGGGGKREAGGWKKKR